MSSEAAAPGLAITRTADVLQLVLDRPSQRNAITHAMLAVLIDALERAAQDDELRAITITAAGDHFCAGMDIAGPNAGLRAGAPASGKPERRPRQTARHRLIDAGPHRLVELLLSVELPVTACVRGTAAGLGCAIALAADLAIVSETSRFVVPQVRRGFTPDCGMSYLLPRLVGLARAREMLLRGVAVGADQAHAWGLITAVVPDADLEDRYAELVDEVRAGPTVALGLTKWLLNQDALEDLRAAMQRESLVVDLSLRTADFKEGVSAFLAGRPAQFEGR
jgi:2-(1,2-epoxy-1,2-dihydrophenyl)acetyl-CoA isomerase